MHVGMFFYLHYDAEVYQASPTCDMYIYTAIIDMVDICTCMWCGRYAHCRMYEHLCVAYQTY